MDIQPQFTNLSTLLTNRLFRIPRYQRAYSWHRKQREDMFNDIKMLRGNSESNHFMATVVGLRRGLTTIVTDQYRVVEVVDGQQRITTLVILLKAIEQNLDRRIKDEKKLASELEELLVKQDELSLVLLQTNHDKSHYFSNYIRSGERVDIKGVRTIADREILSAIEDCDNFVSAWEDKIELLRIIKNQLTFIFHEIDNEETVYTVFEVLNNRGLRVSWLDRLKSMLMGVAFQKSMGNVNEHIEELHNIWGNIYEAIGLRQGLSGEALKFAASLKSKNRPSKPHSEESAVQLFMELCDGKAEKSIKLSYWLLEVAKAVDSFLGDTFRSKAVTNIAQARLLAVSILLSSFSDEEKRLLLDKWEKTSFRVYGLCAKDARTAIGDYVRLAWDVLNTPRITSEEVKQRLDRFSEGKEHDINEAIRQLQNENCYEGWEEELRYLLYRYEEHLSENKGQDFSNEQWARIWEASAAKSIEHIFPQSKGALEYIEPGQPGIFVHRLGNLLLLPPGLNSVLADKDPVDKAESYRSTGLHCATEVANMISEGGWANEQIEEREKNIIKWVRETWA
ncbi:uncharacterized conserved protein [Hahella chejuensis KCTC 2396]|uniref:Uncharacterized conserved protein n=1 Tax=Hahella chejuensis (strain KCTC 2396) TaxID=349521 RepID=Q2SGD6_HAHCH|nr:DUF262 domain-containing protein [Hahella chejuensis]ABC30288.1 uncharacterized conserved protein [Hahella chejuensis KCTC 2396]